MLDLLCRDLAHDLTGGMIEIANMAFMVFIERGYKARDQGSMQRAIISLMLVVLARRCHAEFANQ